MIKNAIETDSKEVLELLNWRLIAVFADYCFWLVDC